MKPLWNHRRNPHAWKQLFSMKATPELKRQYHIPENSILHMCMALNHFEFLLFRRPSLWCLVPLTITLFLLGLQSTKGVQFGRIKILLTFLGCGISFSGNTQNLVGWVWCNLLWVNLLWQEAGLDHLQRTLPTPTMLWFWRYLYPSTWVRGPRIPTKQWQQPPTAALMVVTR